MSIKPFVYTKPTSTYLPFITQEHFQSINPFLAFIIVVCIFYLFYKLCLWRKNQPVLTAGCHLLLHIEQSCANVCINISLQILPDCPTQYSVRSLHTALSMRVTGFCRPCLIITTLPFAITHATTLTNVDIYSEIPISYLVLWKLRTVMKTNYNLYLFLQHGGMVYYSKQLRTGNCLI